MSERLWLAIFVLSFPLVAYVSTLPPQRFRNEITQWGNQKSSTYDDYTSFIETFGANESVVITWPGCELSDARVDLVVDRLRSDLNGLVHQVTSGRHLVDQLAKDADLSRSLVISRLRKIAINSVDLRTAVGCLLTDQGRGQRSEVIQRINNLLAACDVDPSKASYAGLGHNLYMLDKEGLESPFRMVPIIMVVCFGLTWFFIRHLWTTLFINALGVYVGCLSFNVVHLAGVDMNAIIWPLPTLTMLLTVSTSLHFLSYYRKIVSGKLRFIDAFDAHPRLHRFEPSTRSSRSLDRRRVIARRAFRAAVRPVLCCTATTAIGLLSLLLSSSEPVRQFGLFGAITIAIGNTLLLIWFPAFMVSITSSTRALIANDQTTKNTSIHRWTYLATAIQKYRRPIIIFHLAILGSLCIGVPILKTGSGLENFFPRGHQVLTDQMTVEEACGPLNSIELLLEFDNARTTHDRNRIRGIGILEKQIIKQTAIESCVSAATFSPPLATRPSGIQAVTQNVKIRRLKEALNDQSLLSGPNDDQTEIWRISCRYPSLGKIDVRSTSQQITDLANEIFRNSNGSVFADENFEAIVTGEFVLFDSIDRQFFSELLMTYMMAFVAISAVILMMLGNFKAALVALLPNLFPAVVVLGAAGLFGFSLDVASLMTASLALGIAVDDTIHFLLWHRETGSITDSMRYCGTAMLQTSVILGGSVCLYAFCGFLPTVRFGCLLSAMMMVALVGDLILLPALLSGHADRDPMITDSISSTDAR